MMQSDKLLKDFSVIILAAGKSERLGFPKLSLRYDNSNNFLQQIVNSYIRFGCDDVVIVINETGDKYLKENKILFENNTKIKINKHPEWHRFYSLKIGASCIYKNRSVFIHNVDNPFVHYHVLTDLLIHRNKADYISPEYNKKGGHPILLSENVVNNIKTQKEDHLHLKEFLNQYSRFRVPVIDDKILVNINTIEEYQRYFTNK